MSLHNCYKRGLEVTSAKFVGTNSTADLLKNSSLFVGESVFPSCSYIYIDISQIFYHNYSRNVLMLQELVT